MKKIIIALVFVFSVIVAFSGCMAGKHAGHSGDGGNSTSQHSGGCH